MLLYGLNIVKLHMVSTLTSSIKEAPIENVEGGGGGGGIITSGSRLNSGLSLDIFSGVRISNISMFNGPEDCLVGDRGASESCASLSRIFGFSFSCPLVKKSDCSGMGESASPITEMGGVACRSNRAHVTRSICFSVCRRKLCSMKIKFYGYH